MGQRVMLGGAGGGVSPNPELPCAEPVQLGRSRRSGLAADLGLLFFSTEA